MRIRLGDLEAIVASQALSAFRDIEAIRVDTLHRLARRGRVPRRQLARAHPAGRRAGGADGAPSLGQNDRMVWLIRQAAPLHDLGKIAIPDSILLKPGRLEPEEFEVVKTHAVLGARVLADGDSEVLTVAERIARSHHERWDGDGYPDGLAGDAIPLVARLVGVADVFDVLVHERPYKEAWTVEDAAGEIRSGAGAQFDPDVVAAFDALGAGSWTAGIESSHGPQLKVRSRVPASRTGGPWAITVYGANRQARNRGRRGLRPRRLRHLRRRRRLRRRPPSDGAVAGYGSADRRAARRPPRRRDRDPRRQRPRLLSRGGRSTRRRAATARAATASAQAPPAPNPTSPRRPRTLPAVATATLCLLNGERADHGLPPLISNAKLAAAAARLRAGPRRRPVLLPHGPRRLRRARADRPHRLRARTTPAGRWARTSPGAPARSAPPARSCRPG